MSQVTTKSIQDNSVTEPKLNDTGVVAGTYVGNMSVTVGSKGRVISITALTPLTVTSAVRAQATGTLQTITGMTFTPPAGTYSVEFSGDFLSTGQAPAGSIGIYKNATLIDYTKRTLGASTTTLQLLVQVNVGTVTVNDALHSRAWVTVNGTDVVSAKWVATADTLSVTARSFVLVRIA